MSRRSVHICVLVFLALLGLVLFQFQERRMAGAQGVPLDDSWIHFQFARNVASGHGFSYNPGEPTPGSTSPLWVYILAGAYRITGEFVLSAKILGLVFLVFSVWGIYLISLRLDQDERLAFLAALGTVLSGRLLWGALSGMEIGLFTFLTIAGLYAHLQCRDRPKAAYLSSALLGLATLARPEAVVLFVGTLCVYAWPIVGKRNQRVESPAVTTILAGLCVHVLIFSACVLPQIVFCHETTGHLLPNTFYAKTAGALSARAIVLYPAKVAYGFFQDHPVLFLAVPFGICTIFKKALRDDKAWLLLLLWFVGFPLINSLVNPVNWHHGRYTLFLIPFFFLCGVHGLNWIFFRVRPNCARVRAGVFVLSVIISAALLYHWATLYAHNVDNIEDMDVHMGKWLAEHIPLDAVVAASDVGAIAYFSGLRIVDTDGLVTHQIIPFIRTMGREKGAAQFLSRRKPDFIVAFAGEFQFLSARTDVFEAVFSIRVPRNTILGGEKMTVYRARWPNEDTSR